MDIGGGLRLLAGLLLQKQKIKQSSSLFRLFVQGCISETARGHPRQMWYWIPNYYPEYPIIYAPSPVHILPTFLQSSHKLSRGASQTYNEYHAVYQLQ